MSKPATRCKPKDMTVPFRNAGFPSGRGLGRAGAFGLVSVDHVIPALEVNDRRGDKDHQVQRIAALLLFPEQEPNQRNIPQQRRC